MFLPERVHGTIEAHFCSAQGQVQSGGHLRNRESFKEPQLQNDAVLVRQTLQRGVHLYRGFFECERINMTSAFSFKADQAMLQLSAYCPNIALTNHGAAVVFRNTDNPCTQGRMPVEPGECSYYLEGDLLSSVLCIHGIAQSRSAESMQIEFTTDQP